MRNPFNPFNSPVIVSVLLALCFLVGSCRPSRVSDIPISAQTILERLSHEANRLVDFKGSAVVTAYVNGQKGQIGARIQFRHPDQFRIDIQGPFFQTLGVLSIQGPRVRLYASTQNIVFQGTVDDHEAILPGVRLPLAALRTAGIGLIDLNPYKHDQVISYAYNRKRTTIVVADTISGTIRTLWIDPRHSVVEREETSAGGMTTVASFEGYTNVKGFWRPALIRITGAHEEDTLELRYDTQSINSGLRATDLVGPDPKSASHAPLREAMDWLN